MGARSLATKLYRARWRPSSPPLDPKLGFWPFPLETPPLLQKKCIAWKISNCRPSIACNYVISRGLYRRHVSQLAPHAANKAMFVDTLVLSDLLRENTLTKLKTDVRRSQETHENRTTMLYRMLHSSSECSAEKSETEGKPDDRTNTESLQAGPPPEAKLIRGSPVSWLSLGLLVATGAGLVYYYDQEKRRLIKDLKEEAKPGPGVGKAAIGGPFKLVNHEGKEVTEQDFKGNWTLVYFGFTHCPDICPDELQKMAEALDAIEKKDGICVTPIFISVDPERDNVEQVREYVKEFHPRLIGLTGTPEDIKQVAQKFRVYYMKTEEEGLDYLVDHSIIMYLMDPQMDFIKFFGKNYDTKALADGIVEEIKRYKQ